ncbi:MAG: PKD domain-containing protein [Micropruina sp.]
MSFNAGTSEDSDGTISGYAWKFGDNSTGTGVSPNHTYAAAGSYSVELTVTDNDGATDVLTKTVTVTAPTQIAADEFSRTVNNGWGSADVGGAWTVNSASSFGVSGGDATLTTATSATRTAFLNGVSARDVDITTSLSYDKPATGSGIYSAVVGRRIGTSDYRVTITTTSTKVQVQLRRNISGTETSLTTVTLAGGTLAANSSLQIRFQVTGANATTLRAKVWRDGDAEPSAWTTSTTDATAALQVAGGVGLYGYLSGSATNSPVTARFPSFTVKPV